MNMLGKALVLLNVALSLGILIVAIVSYTNPVDFTNSPAKDGNPPGKFKQNADKLRDAWDRIVPALKAVAQARTSLDSLDKYNIAHKWFKEQLDILKNGEKVPIQAIKYNGAVPELFPGDNTKLSMEAGLDLAGKPLMSLKEYDKAIRDEADAMKKQEDRFRAAVDEDTKLTQRRLGLQAQVVRQEGLLAEAKEEASRIEPLYINAIVESELIIKRRASLEARLEELKKLERAIPALGGR
jgi:hypothetical protein